MSENGARDDISLELITHEARFRALEPEWKALYAMTPGASSPLTWEWMNTWWEVFGPIYGRHPGGLRILVLRQREELIGILPLYVRSGSSVRPNRLCMISTGENSNEVVYPEYLDMLYRQEDEKLCNDSFEKAIFEDDLFDWDELYTGLSSSNSCLSAWLHKSQRDVEHIVGYTEHVAYRADLSKGFDAFIIGLPKKQRGNARRLLKLFEDGKGYEFSVASNEQEALDYFHELVEIHTARWKAENKEGAFSTERIKHFHDRLIKALVPQRGVVLAKLSNEGRPVALAYGFIVRNKFDFYQSGIEIESHSELKSPGILLQILLMRHLAEHGITTYDFLAGAVDYKRRLSNGEALLYEGTIIRPSARSKFDKSVRFMKRVLDKAKRIAGGVSGMTTFIE